MSDSTPTPSTPGADMDTQDLYTAVDELIGALGSGAVTADSEDIAGYAGCNTLASEYISNIAAIVAPSSAEQVQAIVAIANRHGIPLWQYTGDNHHDHGRAAPCLRGSVIVDLRRMNRVLEIDEECAYAVIEPGVSFFDLYEHLRAGGHALMMPVPELHIGGVIDYVLAGGHALQPCGMEAVLANGSLVRTGMGALLTSRTWHTCAQGLGPNLDGLFVQSDLGIVTRMGVWLKPRPERYLSCNVTCRHDHDLPRLVDTIRPFLLDGTISNHPVLSNLVSTAARIAGRKEWYPRNGVIPETELERIADETGIGRWNLRFALYGRHEVVEAQLGTLAKAFDHIAQSRFSYREYDGAAPEQAICAGDKSQAGIPEADLGQITQWSGGTSGDFVTMSSVARLDATDVQAHYRLLRGGVEHHGFDHHGMIVLFPRSVLHICCMPYDRTLPALAEAAHRACDAVLEQAAAAGYGPQGRLRDRAALFGYNGHALRRLQTLIKDAVDPNGILSAGHRPPL